MATQTNGINPSDMIAQLLAQAQAKGLDIEQSLAEAKAGPKLRKVEPQAPPVKVHVPVYTGSGKLAAPAKVETGRKASKNVCGMKSPNGPCKKCNGPFNPILHYTMDALKPMDGKGEVSDPDGRAFVGVSTDEKYWGNVVLIGFGRDAINLRPKTFLRLAHAIGAFGAADHVMAVLPESLWLDE